MSATNRTEGLRVDKDVYPTPAYAVRRLIEAEPPGLLLVARQIEFPAPSWLEPCAGNGAIIQALNDWCVLPTRGLPARRKPIWTANEIRPSCALALKRLTPHVRIGDFHRVIPKLPFDVAITNPSYAIAEETIRHCLEIAKDVWMLLRVNFLGSEAREDFFREFGIPDVWVLPNRPSFGVSVRCREVKEHVFFFDHAEAKLTKNCPTCGKPIKKTSSDATEYAWMHWSNWRLTEPQEGFVRRLALTSMQELKEAKAA